MCIVQYDTFFLQNVQCQSIEHGIFGGGSQLSNFNQSEARKQCFLASDWLNLGNFPRKYRALLVTLCGHVILTEYTAK